VSADFGIDAYDVHIATTGETGKPQPNKKEAVIPSRAVQI
jgi:hypothetical protein